MKSHLFILIASFVCLAATLARPSETKAQGEAAEVARMFKACTDSGGTAASNYNAWVSQNGCICPGSTTGSGKVTCSGATGSATSTTSTVSPNPMVTFIQTYQKALDDARARAAAQRDAAIRYNNGIAVRASQNAEAAEDQAQDEDLARYRVRKAGEAQANQAAFSNAHSSASDFLNQNAGIANSTAEPGHGSPAQQKAWKQLHCLAYVSRVAFEDLALDDYKDFHDLAPEASKAFEGAVMDVNCPSAPFPDLTGRNNVDMSQVTGKLKSDLDQAAQIAQRMEKFNLKQTTLPPIPPDVASDPKLAAVWKAQQAINAINDAPNPGKTPEEFAQVIKNRDKLRQAIGDANNAANGQFGAIQVDLTSAPATGPTPQ